MNLECEECCWNFWHYCYWHILLVIAMVGDHDKGPEYNTSDRETQTISGWHCYEISSTGQGGQIPDKQGEDVST